MANLKDLIVSGSSRFISDAFADIIHANKFKTNGGTSSQFVKGDGTLDSNTYLTSADVATYSAGNGIEISTGASPKTISAKLSSTTNGLGLGSAGLSLSLASTSAAGAMSSTDKTNLDTIYGNYLKAGDTIGTVSVTEFNPVSDTVHITSQSLGASQQAQARSNISAQESLVSGTNIKTINGQSILGSGNLEIGGGGGGSITVDTEMSSSSTNPVQNRVITTALSGKVSDVRIGSGTIVNNGIATIPTSSLLPTVSSTDEGKILRVSNGAWALVSPSSIYTGSGAPDNSLGNNGDIYLQTS